MLILKTIDAETVKQINNYNTKVKFVIILIIMQTHHSHHSTLMLSASSCLIQDVIKQNHFKIEQKNTLIKLLNDEQTHELLIILIINRLR